MSYACDSANQFAVPHKLFAFALAILTGVGIAASTSAAPKSAPSAKRAQTEAAQSQVQEALYSEIRGLAEDRNAQLEQVVERLPDFAPARWHLGQVRLKEQWVAVDEIPRQLEKDPRIAAYYKVRDKHTNSVEDQLALANWCHERGLGDQERAHLTKVLELSTDHAEARSRLGFRQVGGAWMSAEETKQSQSRAETLAKDLAQWRSKLQSIRQGLTHRTPTRRARAMEQLLAIHDPAAIPAMEAELALASEEAASALVRALSEIADNSAALALARQAVASQWPVVREAAIAELKSRAADSYMPALLAALYTPVQSQAELYTTPNGRLMYRHVFAREGQDANEVLVVENEYRRVANGGDANETLARALLDMNARFQDRERQAAQQNAFTEELNNRIAAVLTSISGASAPLAPGDWWNWWNDKNEVFTPASKATVQQVSQQSIAVVDTPIVSSGSSGGGTTMDCLAEGTKVCTSIGPVAIERVKVGDLVLSQHPDTGELAYKPVLRTTVRPPSNLVTIKSGYDEITTSGGHPLWVSGQGWVKARDIEPGAELHTVRGTFSVDVVEKEGFAETYNLIVADFHTYFAGDKKILSHDNTVRQATRAIVPGLAND